jgi:hypothetical protein
MRQAFTAGKTEAGAVISNFGFFEGPGGDTNPSSSFCRFCCMGIGDDGRENVKGYLEFW